jgi:hypothetical protein
MATTVVTGHLPGQGFPPKPVTVDVVIPNGAAIPADAVDLNGWSLVGIYLPASTEGATLGFTVCATETGTYVDLYDFTGTIIAITLGSSRAISLDPSLFVGWRYIKPKTASNQTGDCTVQLAVRPIA